MPHGVHKHGRGWRGTLSVSTATYPTQTEAAAALEALRARLNQARQPAPTQAATASAGLDPFKPSCDYPRPLFHFT
jgi:hypothetical protein